MRLGTRIITKFANKIKIVNNITQIRKPIEKELEKFLKEEKYLKKVS